MSRDREHQYNDLIARLHNEGWPTSEIAAHIKRSTSYVGYRISIKDPLGPLAPDPGPLTVERVFARFPINAHKSGGW